MLGRSGALLLVVCLAAAARADPVLTELRLQSDARIDEAGLRALLPLAVGRPVTPADLEETRRLLELKGIFRRIDIETVPRDGGLGVVIRLARKRVLRRVTVRGGAALGRRERERLVRFGAGTVYEPAMIEEARQRILARYEKIGFAGTRVDVLEEERGAGEMDLEFTIDEGTPLVIETVEVDGDPGIWTDGLPRRIRRLPGQRRTRDLQRASERRLLRALRQAGYFEARVEAAWEESERRLRLEVDAGPPFTLVVSGNRAMSEGSLLRLIDLYDRLLITDNTWRELGRRMEEAYRKRGYYRAEVRVTVKDGPPKSVRFDVQEGRRYFVRRIAFEGNARLSSRELVGEMATRTARFLPWPRSGALDDAILEEDLERIRQRYATSGFESAEIIEVRKEIDERNGAIDLTVALREGPRTVVREVALPAVPGLDGSALPLVLRKGAPFDPAALSKDRQSILDALGRTGYAQPSVEAKVERMPRGERRVRADVGWVVEPGLRQEAGRIVAQGNVDTRDRVILREIPQREGEPLDTRALLDGQANVYRLGLFRRVAVRPLGDEDAAVRDIGVLVAERPAGTLQWGGGYNTRDGLLAFAGVGYDNLQGLARRVRLYGEFNLDPKTFVPDQYLASLEFNEPRLFESPWRYGSNLVGERATRATDPYSIERVTWSNAVDRKLRAKLQGGLEIETEYANVFDVPPDARLTSKDDGILRSVGFGPLLIDDRRNDPFSPTQGFIQTLRLRYAPPGVSTVQLARLNAQHTGYVPLWWKTTFVYSTRVGFADALSGAGQVPIRDRFFLGGRNTVRGFKENSIGPRGSEGTRTGGDLALNANVELLVPLIYGFGAAFFADGGGLYLVGCDASCRAAKGIRQGGVSFQNFRRSVGPGLRYRTPVGALSLDYGIKLDRRGGESFGRLHFGIGVSF